MEYFKREIFQHSFLNELCNAFQRRTKVRRAAGGGMGEPETTSLGKHAS